MINFDKRKLNKYIIVVVVFVAVFGAGFFIGKRTAVCEVCKPETVDFSLFWDAYDKLRQNYIDSSKVTDQQVIYGAIDGMTKSFGDPYTDFFNPADAKLFEQDLQGSFEGIGVEVGVKNNQLTVVAPLPGSPGENAGLKSGDVIEKVNGKSTSDMSVDDAVNLIRGDKGTQVTLSILRAGWKDTKDFKITRDTIKVDSVKWQLKNNDVAYIHIFQFDQTLSADLKTIVYQILKSPAKKIVIDLRGNPGGYLQVCQDISGWFLKNGQLVTTEDFGKGKQSQQYLTQGSGELADYPTVVLIDGGSASAAEILAGALRDDRNIQLIGEKSFGKGSVQEVDDLNDGQSFIKITIAKWLTPKGNSISGEGLKPDVEVSISDADVAANKDPQLDKALEIISTLK